MCVVVELLVVLALLAVVAVTVLTVGMFVFWVVTLVDVVRFTNAEYEQVGHSRAGWLATHVGALVVGLPFVASLLYWFWPRRLLLAARQGQGHATATEEATGAVTPVAESSVGLGEDDDA